jgi:MtN3 and saliva related transmembrane protein
MWLRELIEFLFGAGLFINALLFLPQIYVLVKSKDAKGISFVTFFGFSILQLITISYGFMKQDFLLAFGTMPSFLLCTVISLLIVIYRYRFH